MGRSAFVLACFALMTVGCGPSPAIVPAPPLPTATTNVATSAPAPSTTTAQPKVPPPPLEVASAPPLDVPPAPTVPPRTCPTLPDVKPESLGPRTGKFVIVTVTDYLTLAPISAVQVDVTHFEHCTRHGGCKPSHPHPASLLRISTKTNKQGRVTLNVPDLDYQAAIPTTHKSADYLTYSSIYDLGKQKCHDLLIEKRSQDGRILAFDMYLIPESMRAIQNRDQAFAAAQQNQELMDWLRNHQDATPTIRDNIASWQVGFGYDNRFKRLVQVNAFDASSFMLGRWTD